MRLLIETDDGALTLVTDRLEDYDVATARGRELLGQAVAQVLLGTEAIGDELVGELPPDLRAEGL